MPQNAENLAALTVDARLKLGERLIGDGAHEIRSQLAVILLELGKLDHPAARRIENDVQAASDTANRVATLFRLMMAVHLESLPINIQVTLREVIQRLQMDHPGSNIRLELPEQCQAITGHRGFLTVAIHCLIDNAIRHTPSGTQIVIQCRGNGIVVQDDGPGLPSNVLQHFTAPFVRGRGPTAGPGLGLATAHQVARLHGGDCRALSPSSGGSAISLTWRSAHVDASATSGQST
jgi:two-component system, OmpR family, sensor histidine kinase QseC